MVYKSNIRSCIEFCSVVYHSLLTGDQAARIEGLQYQALKCIYGVGESYRSLRERAGLDLLGERREKISDRFMDKSLRGGFEH